MTKKYFASRSQEAEMLRFARTRTIPSGEAKYHLSANKKRLCLVLAAGETDIHWLGRPFAFESANGLPDAFIGIPKVDSILRTCA